MTSPARPGPLVWVDVETTGLDTNHDLMLELALVVTDNELEPYAAYEAVFSHKEFGPLGAVVWDMHNKNGLFDACRASDRTYRSVDADLDALLSNLAIFGNAPMCGSTVHFDRSFIKRFLPLTYGHFHYRNIDVSSFKELAIRWAPAKEWQKSDHHRAMPDILDSIKALRHYRSAFGL